MPMNREDGRAPWWRAVIAACALATVAICGPPAQARSDSTIWEGDDQSVVLASQDEETAPPNHHPATMAPRDIERMLTALHFRYADQETDAPPVAVFNEEQVEILGEALATGLARATPSQDVTFSLIGSHRISPGAFARRNRLTSGRAFVRNGKLNVIFGEIQGPYRKKNIYGRLEQDFYPREYGSRAPADAQEAVLVASTDVSLRTDQQGQRDDWVVFDSPVAGAAPAPRPQDSVTAEPAPPPAPASAGPRLPAASSAAADRPDAGSGDIEQRLETLKRLRQKELISEEVYREKVDEILNEL
jgi:hypothetical protein